MSTQLIWIIAGVSAWVTITLMILVVAIVIASNVKRESRSKIFGAMASTLRELKMELRVFGQLSVASKISLNQLGNQIEHLRHDKFFIIRDYDKREVLDLFEADLKQFEMVNQNTQMMQIPMQQPQYPQQQMGHTQMMNPNQYQQQPYGYQGQNQANHHDPRYR